VSRSITFLKLNVYSVPAQRFFVDTKHQLGAGKNIPSRRHALLPIFASNVDEKDEHSVTQSFI
jgi:hypothetical protein